MFECPSINFNSRCPGNRRPWRIQRVELEVAELPRNKNYGDPKSQRVMPLQAWLPADPRSEEYVWPPLESGLSCALRSNFIGRTRERTKHFFLKIERTNIERNLRLPFFSLVRLACRLIGVFFKIRYGNTLNSKSKEKHSKKRIPKGFEKLFSAEKSQFFARNRD